MMMAISTRLNVMLTTLPSLSIVRITNIAAKSRSRWLQRNTEKFEMRTIQ